MRKSQRRKAAVRDLDRAATPVLESLEERLLMAHHSASRHHVTGSPTIVFPEHFAGTIRRGGGGVTVTQISHLYGHDQLTALNPNFPLYNNDGEFQTIVVVGSAAPALNDTILRKSNINLFSAAMGIGGTPILEDPTPGQTLDPTGATDPIGAIATTAQLEWAHALAPAANIVLTEVASTNGVIAQADLQAGLNEAITTLGAIAAGAPGPFNKSGPGGVIVTGMTTQGEDATVEGQIDAIFNRRDARYVSFIAPAGDSGGALSMPAMSPNVTSVGETVIQVAADGTRVSETASLNSGGGSSRFEGLPAYQSGIRVSGRGLTSRSGPDLSLAGTVRGSGLFAYYDPTATATNPGPFSVDGSGFSAAIFSGMVADANELRASLGKMPLGRGLNGQLYLAYKQNPNLNYTDIVQGNNTLHQAVPGFDLASGMGAPNAANLIPAMADILTSENINLTFSGDQIAAIGQAINGSAIIPFQGTGVLKLGTQFATLNLNIATPTIGTSSTSPTGTATLTIPSISRGLDNSLVGDGTITVTNTNNSTTPATTTTTTYKIQLRGQVSGRTGHNTVSGQIYTVDALGRRVKQGQFSIFEGTFKST